MASIFEKWNKNIDGEGLAKDVKEVEKNGGNTNYEETPHGEYVVKIDKMELKESSKGDPMFSCWFKIVEGEYKDKLIFMNQIITRDFQIHIVNEFLRSMETEIAIEFDGNYEHYNDMIMDVMEVIDGELEFLLSYTENKKGYNVFKIQEVYEV